MLLLFPYCYDYIPGFLPGLGIPVSLDNLVQRIASIYYRPYLSRLRKFFQENQIFRMIRYHSANYSLAACQRGPDPSNLL